MLNARVHAVPQPVSDEVEAEHHQRGGEARNGYEKRRIHNEGTRVVDHRSPIGGRRLRSDSENGGVAKRSEPCPIELALIRVRRRGKVEGNEQRLLAIFRSQHSPLAHGRLPR